MLFQPIVDLSTENVVGYEALARGPAGSPWESPHELFAEARREGRLREMDWACRAAAVRDARAVCAQRPAWRLFLNTEPEVLGTTCPEELLADWFGGTDELDIVVEVTERALVHGLRRLLAAVQELRDTGCEIALDDVGSNQASVALLPMIEPDVVKLDATLLRSTEPSALAALRAVESYVERSGALVIAEGIESRADRSRAEALGAQWGQGYLFARPRPLDPSDTAGGRPVPAWGPARRAPGRTLALPAVEPPRLGVATEWLSDRLCWFAEQAHRDAALNVLLLRLSDPAVAPAGFFEQLAVLQEVCALSLVALGEQAGLVGDEPRRQPGADQAGPDVAAVLLGPSVAHAVIARRDGAGRYDVLLEDRPGEVAALARDFLAQPF